MRGMAAKSAYIEGETQQYVYSTPLNVVWGHARQLLFQRGYRVRSTDGFNVETEWMTDAGGKRHSRYLLTGMERSPDQCQVQFMLVEEELLSDKWSSSGAHRDLGMELELIMLVEPDAYARMEAEGDKRSEAAKKE